MSRIRVSQTLPSAPDQPTPSDLPTAMLIDGEELQTGGIATVVNNEAPPASSTNADTETEKRSCKKRVLSEYNFDGLSCPICMEPWKSQGDHQVCCLPCGHIYGMSCINRWIQHRGGSSAKCPQCNKKITLKNVRKLYASPVIVVDENSQKKVESLGAENKSLEAENRCLKTERANLLDIQDSLLKELCHLKEMADDIPHGGGSPQVEDEPNIMPLPPRIRPFDPERYHPQEHVLPPSTFHHFTDFTRRAPADLLLREPESHLSHQACEVDSRFTRGYGSIIAREWYMELPDAVRHIVDEAGFGPFCVGLSRHPASRTLLGALVERWWDTTNSFHFSATGDMTMTPYDFSMLTGLDVTGRPIPYDTDMGEWEAAWTYLLGAHPPTDRSSGRVRYTWFAEQYRRTTPETFEAIQQYARGFLMFLLGTTLFSDRGNTVGLYLLSALVDLSQVRHFDWGGAGLATLYCYMSATSRGRGSIVGGYWRAWELWVFAYFPTLAPEPEVEAPLDIPYSRRFEGRCRPKPRETLPYLRQYFDTVRVTEVTWQPWLAMPGYSRFQFAGAWGASRYRVLFEGPVGRAWFLGERFMRQTMGNPAQEIPSPPPLDMRSTKSLTSREVDDLMLGSDAVFFLEEGEYATYLHTYLMPPLTGIRTPTSRAADMPSSSRARAVEIPSTSRASTSGGRSRGIPTIRQCAGWPDLPTELTGWWYGTPYQIPLEASLLDHRYVSDPDSPPPPRGYIERLLEMVASLESMVLRRETMLYISGIPVTPLQPGASRPSRAAGIGVSTRSRGRR